MSASRSPSSAAREACAGQTFTAAATATVALCTFLSSTPVIAHDAELAIGAQGV